MDFLLCKYAKREAKKTPIMCEKTGTACAHQYLCPLSMKYKQLDTAKDCPGQKEEKKKAQAKTKKGNK